MLWCLCSFLTAFESKSQTRAFNLNAVPEPAVAFGVGVSSYYGDLQTQAIIPQPSLFVEYNKGFTGQLVGKFALSFYRIGSSDAKSGEQGLIERNLSFKANNFELSSMLEYRLLDGRDEKRSPLNPFIFIGIGITTNNPRTEINGKNYALRPLRTENVDYSGFAVVFPVGIGVRARLSSAAFFIVEIGYRATSTDYLDVVSSVYADPALLASDLSRKLADRKTEIDLPTARVGDIRGNPELRDGYIITSIKLELNLRYLKKRFSRKKPKFR